MVDLLVETFRSLRAHSLRFGLTSLGIVWGAFMLTYLSANMKGTEVHFSKALTKMGPRIVHMGPGTIRKERVGERGAREVELEGEDAGRIGAILDVERASPNIDLYNTLVRGGGRTKLMHVQGVNHHAEVIRNFRPARGRFLSPLDVERARPVAFLGAEAAERLFGHGPAVGRRVQIEGVLYRVVGVAERKGPQLVDSVNLDDRKVMIPYTVAQRWITRDDAVHTVIFEPRLRELGARTIRRAREVTGLHHDFDPDLTTALWFFNIHDVLQLVWGLLFALRVFLVFAGVTTLLVGAVGVMNIMLVVVGERRSEIGLRKAVGGTSRAIFGQFLAEATVVCLLSGLLGAGLGVGLAQLTARLLPRDSPMASIPVLDPVTLVTIVAALVLVGITAGIVPALRAARVPPAEALRAV